MILALFISLAALLCTLVSAPAAYAYSSEELAFLTLINNYRAQNGVPPLTLSPTLSNAALGHDFDMATYGYNFGSPHTGSDGSTPLDRMRAQGYNYNTWTGENIAYGYVSANDAFQAWRASPSHNQNMLKPEYHVIGIARYQALGSQYGTYWTTDFGGAYEPAEQLPPDGALNYYFTWYDSTWADNWVLMANPATSPYLSFMLSIGRLPGDLSRFNGGVVGPGSSITPKYDGVYGGPVRVSSISGQPAVVSQRVLWPKGGNSLEEISGTEALNLSNHFWWTWYDSASPGFRNWILVANPSTTDIVYYKIKIGGGEWRRGILGPGANGTHVFMGVIGGPLEVQAWQDGVDGSIPADVMASQRVLSNGGSAFNEVPGIADRDLKSDYLWTWYDNVGGHNWVLIANPATQADGSANHEYLYYRIKIGGSTVLEGGPVLPGQKDTPMITGVVGGPVEVTTYSNADRTVALRSIASQRVIWGPSFEEVPGSPAGTDLSTSYFWTWYDQAEGPGVRNWVLVGNPDPVTPIYYEIKVANTVRDSGTLAGGEQITPTFDGVMGGPVEVDAWLASDHGTPARVMASQRVLWNGFFNETLGTVLD